MLNQLITLNGIYDIICGICILLNSDCIFANLHSNMFIDKEAEKLNKRLLAYWILTYGIMRYLSEDRLILCLTYLIEAIIFAYEYYFYKSCEDDKIVFVVLSSLIIAYAIYISE